MLDQLLVITGITVLVMISPGPDMVIVVRNTMLGGRGGGLRTSAGVLTGNMVHISYCLVGIGWLISTSIVAFSVLRYAGAAYLIWLGLSSFFSNRESMDMETGEPANSHRGWFLQGFINNVLNPKGTLFYLGVFTMVITPDTTIPVTVLLVAVMMAISGGFWLLFVMTLDQPAVRRFIDRSQRTVKRLFGVLLISLGLRVALVDH